MLMGEMRLLSESHTCFSFPDVGISISNLIRALREESVCSFIFRLRKQVAKARVTHLLKNICSFVEEEVSSAMSQRLQIPQATGQHVS